MERRQHVWPPSTPEHGGLLAPTLHACQCMITPAHGPFTLGPKPKEAPCGTTPKYIAYEHTPGPDGRCGAMAVCETCTVELKKQKHTWARVRLAILPRKASR